jgi:hypothetical protein
MRAWPKLLKTLAVSACIGATVGGCQTDPEPQDPATVEETLVILDRKPNVVLGAMDARGMPQPYFFVLRLDPDAAKLFPAR